MIFFDYIFVHLISSYVIVIFFPQEFKSKSNYVAFDFTSSEIVL